MQILASFSFYFYFYRSQPFQMGPEKIRETTNQLSLALGLSEVHIIQLPVEHKRRVLKNRAQGDEFETICECKNCI